MTPADPFRALPRAAQHAMLLDGLNHVLRAARRETTVVSKQWAYGPLVKPHHANANGLNELKKFPHRSAELLIGAVEGR